MHIGGLLSELVDLIELVDGENFDSFGLMDEFVEFV